MTAAGRTHALSALLDQPTQRAEAIGELGMLATPAQTQKALLGRLFDATIDLDEDVRAVAVHSLGLVGARARGALRLAAANPQNLAIVAATHRLLGVGLFVRADVIRLTEVLASSASSDTNPLVRSLAARSIANLADLACLDSVGRRALGVLFLCLFDIDNFVRQGARAGILSVLRRSWQELRRIAGR
ncbi:MAG: hypothetical protein Q8O67_31655 [Deltaproteobacteria bacterium]|nr:hypothetical protein [Deltaproteobacteria bacterium]